jgi:hypothetical protein
MLLTKWMMACHVYTSRVYLQAENGLDTMKGVIMNAREGECEMIELEDAAEELSTTGLRLLMLIREGSLHGVEYGGTWHIQRASLERLKNTGISRPEQKGCAATCKASSCGCK